MRPRPVIGLTMHIPALLPGDPSRACTIGQAYLGPLAAAKAIPWPVALPACDGTTLRLIYDRLDGVFLTGGADIDPGHYDQPRQPHCGASDPVRDWVDLTLARWAVADGKPLLGVCRGFQVLNVACGGALHQDLTACRPSAVKHDCFSSPAFEPDHLAHHVRLLSGSRLAEVLGCAETEVNSRHHQGVGRLAPGLQATAVAPDDLIEGVEGVNGAYVVGVQWHPEDLVAAHPAMRRLFEDFVDAARSFAATATGRIG
jgi:putative glutamine amidotransferase